MTKVTIFLKDGQKIVLTTPYKIEQIQQKLKQTLLEVNETKISFTLFSVSDTDSLVLNVDKVQAFLFTKVQDSVPPIMPKDEKLVTENTTPIQKPEKKSSNTLPPIQKSKPGPKPTPEKSKIKKEEPIPSLIDSVEEMELPITEKHVELPSGLPAAARDALQPKRIDTTSKAAERTFATLMEKDNEDDDTDIPD